ncbi:MAG TPA: GNAT family N-acetyltransferase [Syntrophobacteraceae bacterium]|nr:GNAT family N-acetyltransferase [Syntrophobacteraceae bacterium]
MSIFNLDKVFKPQSVVVIGASDKPGNVGQAVLRNLREGGYDQPVYVVNPKYRSVLEIPTHRSVLDIGKEIDLAVVATPLAVAPQIVRECVQAKVAGVIIVSAGGREIGAEGLEIERAIKEEAERGSIRVVGPNCLGLISTGSKLNASFASHMALPGSLAFVSQSGAICTAILDLSLKRRIGFSHFVSIGSMLDVDFGDLINYLGNDPGVRSIVLYMESLTNIRKFMSAARAVSRIRPIVALKSGRCAAGARAAKSHTGAMVGDDAVYDAAFERAGIVRVDTIEELFDCAELMAKQPRPAGPGLAIITNAGGPGVMAADALASYGMEPAMLTPDTHGSLNEILPAAWSHGNPIDILGDATAERYGQAIEVCFAAQEMDALLVILTPQAMTDPSAVATVLTEVLKGRQVGHQLRRLLDRMETALTEGLRGQRYSVFAAWMGGVDVEQGRAILHEAGIPTYETPERAVSAFVHMFSYQRNLELLQQLSPKSQVAEDCDRTGAGGVIRRALSNGASQLGELDSKAVLRAYGIPVVRTLLAENLNDVLRLVPSLGYPLAMKLASPDISHKTDVQGVQLNLFNEEDLRNAYHRIMNGVRERQPEAQVLGVTVQPMLQRVDYELIVGSRRDSSFGPIVLFGMGGIASEILRDQAIALCPLNRLLARRIMEKTKIYQLLKGFRNRPPADLAALEEVLVRLAQLVTDFPEIVELDINPLVVSNGTPCAVDARIVLAPSDVPSPMHLVISPYPNQYESHVTTKGNLELLVRPIKPEDASLLEALFTTLSPRSIFLRFFSPMKEIPQEMLARFTQIDYDRDMALVAIDQAESQERMLGVARLVGDPDGVQADFAVLVGDPWQGKGVGAELLKRLMRIARERGFHSLTGTVLAENTTMLALGRRFGFTIKSGAGPGEFDLKIDLRELPADF